MCGSSSGKSGAAARPAAEEDATSAFRGHPVLLNGVHAATRLE